MARISSGGSRVKLPPKVPTTYNVQDIQSLAPTRTREAEVTPRAGATTYTPPPTPAPTYNVQDIQSQPAYTPPAPAPTPTYDIQRTQTLATPPPTYDVQSIQSQREETRQVSAATPTEQAAALGGGVPERIDPYFADLSSGMQYLYSRFPENVGGVGTPTELAAGGGFGPSSFQWSESPASLAELAQGRTPVGPALAAADTVATFLTEFGVRPEFVTSFVTQSLGLTPTDMMSMGYAQDLYGRWIALEFGDEELVGGGETGVAGPIWDGDGGAGVGRYTSPTGFRSGYTSGLIQWRIGF